MADRGVTSRRFTALRSAFALTLAFSLAACGGHPQDVEDDPTVTAVERWELSLDSDASGSASVRLAKHLNGDVTSTGTLLLRRGLLEQY
ncbi:MAG: hypothetical protein HY900_23785, partial [Deltaproteobacteria bacterium]|nr:hypothetical protein [Deltaproteobacteria bacterium]